MNITIYTTPTCPKCKILKTKLEQKNLNYTENQNEEEMVELGLRSVPYLNIDGKLLNFGQANEWINNLEI